MTTRVVVQKERLVGNRWVEEGEPFWRMPKEGFSLRISDHLQAPSGRRSIAVAVLGTNFANATAELFSTQVLNAIDADGVDNPMGLLPGPEKETRFDFTQEITK